MVIDKDTILQLESHCLNVTGIGTATTQRILVNNGATLIIDGKENGSISYAAADTGPRLFSVENGSKLVINGGTIESARLNYGSKSGSLLTVNGGTIIGTGTDDNNEPAVVLDTGNVELRGGTYMPNYLYARNGASVTVFEAVYNGTNPPAYGSDDNSTITFGQ